MNRILFIPISLVLGITAIIITSAEPFEAIKAFFTGPFSNLYFFGNMLSGSIPLIFTGLSASVAFYASNFNLGIEGQVYFSSLVGIFTASILNSFPAYIAVPVAIAAAFATGGTLGIISGFLKTKWKVNELISSLLISYTIIYISDFVLESIFFDPKAGMAASPYINEKFFLGKLLFPSNLHIGLIIAVFTALFLFVALKKSVPGYEIKISGLSKRFGFYGGINVNKVIMFSMFLSGGLAGMGGIIDVFGVEGRVIRGFSSGYGWNGIAVALIAKNNPLFVIPAAVFFSYLESGAQAGSILSDITPEIAKIIQASVFLLVSIGEISGQIKKKKLKETIQAWQEILSILFFR